MTRSSNSSFVHDYLATQGMLGNYKENRPGVVRCVHPLVTLFEKLDAMARRYERSPVEADTFVRHYEDVAQIIRSVEKLPEIEMTPVELVRDLVARKDVRELPSPEEPALHFDDPDKRLAVEAAYAEIGTMFWGPRIPLAEACATIRSWLAKLQWTL